MQCNGSGSPLLGCPGGPNVRDGLRQPQRPCDGDRRGVGFPVPQVSPASTAKGPHLVSVGSEQPPLYSPEGVLGISFFESVFCIFPGRWVIDCFGQDCLHPCTRIFSFWGQTRGKKRKRGTQKHFWSFFIFQFRRFVCFLRLFCNFSVSFFISALG